MIYGKSFPVIMLVILPIINMVIMWIVTPLSWGWGLWFVLPIIEIVYGLYPAKYTPETYLRKRGYEKIVIEFGFIKTFLFITIPILSIISIINQIVFRYYSDFSPDYFSEIVSLLAVFSILSLLPAIFGALLRIVTQIAKKEFRFYLAKAYFIVVSKQDDDYKKVRHLISGSNSYNKYLRRTLKFEIKDIKKVYSKFVYANTTEKNEIIKSVCESVEGSDRLKLARYLSTLSKIPETEFFVSESSFQKLKTIGTFLAAALPIVISMIQFILRSGK